MRNCWKLILPLTMLVACERDETAGMLPSSDEGLYHEMIELGEKLEDPYAVGNVRSAVASLYPTKADRIDITPTDLYVRFLPRNDEEYERLLSLDLFLTDHPMDYQILREGDYYHDPLLAEDDITWQYAVVDKDFVFPEGIRYELLDECYISEHDPVTRSGSGLDWDAVEKEAYRLTGNAALYEDATKAGSGTPSGRITIEDPSVNGGKPFGVSGVQVNCNSFVKFASAYTDRDGYYEMSKKFSSKPRYRLIFKNQAGFSIGFNLILVPASVSTLGKGAADGIDFHVSRDSEDKLFRRCVVNNAAYEYISRCTADDLDITVPPRGLRFWMFKGLDGSSTVMLHHGALLDNALLSRYLGSYAPLLRIFLPDITIGTAGRTTYADIRSSVVHELAHASHFAQVGSAYWDKFIAYIIRSYVTEGGEAYGSGNGTDAGYCEVGEMWAYFLESVLYKDRYGGALPSFGTSFWFYPQIFRYLYDRGVTVSELFRALKSGVTSRDDLQDELVRLYPDRESMIVQVFNRYGR